MDLVRQFTRVQCRHIGPHDGAYLNFVCHVVIHAATPFIKTRRISEETEMVSSWESLIYRLKPDGSGKFDPARSRYAPARSRHAEVSEQVASGKVAVTGSTYFGEVDRGVAQKTVSICNVGDCKLHVFKVGFSSKRRHFRLINNPFPATLHPGSCLGVVIEYRASCESECCELVIESDDPHYPVKMRDVVAFTRCDRRCGRYEKGCGCARDEEGGHVGDC
jgi:hypothetical protein